MIKPAALKVLWANCVERLKDRVNNRPFWEAIENTHALAIEGNQLIVGLASEEVNRTALLRQGSNLNAIQTVVQELFNQPLEVRFIEGTTPEDWEATKSREARIAAMRTATVTQQIKRDAASGGWEGLYDLLARQYAQTPNRSLPQGKARYANEALYTLTEAMDSLYPENPGEQDERSLARVLDRIANASEIPAPVLAFELERIRAYYSKPEGE